MRALIRHSAAMLRNRKLLALHLVLNAALLAAASFWLLIPEAHAWQLVFAVLSAIAIAGIFLWLHSSTLIYALEPRPVNLRVAVRPRVLSMIWLLVGLAAMFWGMSIVEKWRANPWQLSGYLYSKAPQWLRPTSGAMSYTHGLLDLETVLFWFVIPSLFLPFIAGRVTGRRFRAPFRALASGRYWLAMVVLCVVGVWLTRLIIGWVPGKTLAFQTISVIVRLAIAYVVATSAWLLATGVLGYFSCGPQRPIADDAKDAAGA